ncbi:phosphate-starvation-inducible PsiE family protein [Halomonas sp. 328]|uniref:phosphate-starvation-inducible PsiE family protein n=1 Tax=Halomonas sp. 328 TaxID=2776704 RepID=UPI0018A7B178|nr:phosphate-starvation-inducible PsiE family protein [Halomonas sp. 328]MBF8221909.1 phosphate-starvation-inducible PsiE family protein [Halomonas sp. 328]
MDSDDKAVPRYPKLLHDELPEEHEDPLIRKLHFIIRYAIKLLAVLMVLVIIWGVLDVIYVLYTKFVSPPLLLFDVSDIFVIFGAFMVVLIAVEIFINIRLYLGTNVLPIRLVIATALMAIARKVIILDISTISAEEMLAIAAIVLALGVTHWLVGKQE